MCLTGIMLDLKETCETVLLEDLSSEVASHIAHHTEEYVFLASVVILSEGSQFSSNILTKQIVLVSVFVTFMLFVVTFSIQDIIQVISRSSCSTLFVLKYASHFEIFFSFLAL